MRDCPPPHPNQPIVVWFRDDQRLADNPALAHAASSGYPVVCVYIHDPEPRHGRALGAAVRWWLHESLRELDGTLRSLGGGLVLLRGEEQEAILTFVKAIRPIEVCWNRRYSLAQRQTDAAIKSALEARAVSVSTFNGHLLREPWKVATRNGEPFQVFGAYWRAARQDTCPEPPRPSPDALRFFRVPESARTQAVGLADLKLQPDTPDWAAGLRETWKCGESGAQERLRHFVAQELDGYATNRDAMARDATSKMSPYLRFGNLSVRQIWYAALAAAQAEPLASEHLRKFQDELGWREFSYHLLYHFPPLHQVNFRRQFDAMPWRADKQALRAWQRGRTGYPIVDAGMRQLWRTGWMHNRARMVTASFLVKHLLIDWREGESWFWDTLVDADEANNPAGWQWVAGSGADAAPYFRIFNPVLQGQKFDPQGNYVRHWLPEIHRLPAASIHAPWQAAPDQLAAASVRLGETYPRPIVDHQQARTRALDAFETLRRQHRDR
ncbi:MAG TPA: deoxyribodipyrimidine photo-lyase [Trinickia sp.]|uniref:cryptochrome/photolyase family protein n=1 Tax=Trinickia sp. TaxID=2571163 RepID=UPI002B5640A9|nr:deoxyribodipyrimidine photo-lyase [Trinickia sp.]HVW52141.1 deoxyribodipyrimidine photo-lyase [Trinickia sp.]